MIRIANCIITPPHNPYTILYVKTVAFNDLSLPGKTMAEGVDTKELLTESIKDKTEILITSYKDIEYVIRYEAKGEEFERHIFVADTHEGSPTTRGDLSKYGIEIYSPNILYKNDWTIRTEVKLAPGMYKTILTYYMSLPDFQAQYPAFTPLATEYIDKIAKK